MKAESPEDANPDLNNEDQANNNQDPADKNMEQEEQIDSKRQKKGNHHNMQPLKKWIWCLTGVDKHYIERDLIKYLRKYLESGNQELPVHSIHKKRNQSFAFLNFATQEQKMLFKELFYSEMAPKVAAKRMNLRENTNYKFIDGKQFKKVKDAESMLLDGLYRKDQIQKKITDEDILEEMKTSIEDKVTPYHMFTYDE